MTAGVLEGRIALVTGASRGIGYAAARAFAEEGAHVVALARTQGGLEELDDEIRNRGAPAPTLVPLDIQNGEGIDQLGRALFDRFGRLDILLSAAGELGLITPIAHLEPRTWDRAVAVNMTANYRLIRSLDPLLRSSAAARAIFITSGAAAAPRAFWGPYAATKAGLEMLVGVYQDEVAHTAIRCALVNPGPMRTRMRAQAFPGEDPLDLDPPEALAPLLVDLARAASSPPAGVVQYKTWKAEAEGGAPPPA